MKLTRSEEDLDTLVHVQQLAENFGRIRCSSVTMEYQRLRSTPVLKRLPGC